MQETGVQQRRANASKCCTEVELRTWAICSPISGM